MKILCVDDELVARKIYEKGLAIQLPDDYILLADCARKAREIMDNDQIDVVITDLVMPEETGIDLLRTIRDQSAWTEVILVTAHASLDTAVEAMRLGARDYIEKPIDISLLCEKIENIREYQRRANESEDYRHAKEMVEIDAAEEISLLEENIEGKQLLIRSIRKILVGEPSTSAEQRLGQLKELLQLR